MTMVRRHFFSPKKMIEIYFAGCLDNPTRTTSGELQGVFFDTLQCVGQNQCHLEFPIKMYLTWFKGFNELIHCSCATSTWYQFFIFLLSFVATLMAEHIFLVRSRGWLLKDNSLGTNIEKRLFMWLLWILFLDLFGHRAIVSAEPCILETNDSCDWKDVKDVNDITSEAIVARLLYIWNEQA